MLMIVAAGVVSDEQLAGHQKRKLPFGPKSDQTGVSVSRQIVWGIVKASVQRQSL